MLFSSYSFIFLFLPIFLALYFLSPKAAKNPIILVASIVFYALGDHHFISVLIASCLIDTMFSRFLSPSHQRKKRNTILTILLTLNFGLLCYFKYFNFFIAQCNNILSFFKIDDLQAPQIILPLGISFFTFHKVSYLVDVYRGTSPPQKNFRDYLLYILMFPQIIAGPIIRYHDIAGQLKNRSANIQNFFIGSSRFITGLAKKVLIANQLAPFVDRIFMPDNLESLTSTQAWLGALAYTLQIYFDFSGYSDMAIGLAKMIGFDFLENFNQPYISQTFSEFWKRWHISLTNFLRDYLYVPLGGNRKGRARTYINLWAVFLLSGLWHGANSTFIIWGAIHGFFLTLDKLFWLKHYKRIPKTLNIGITFLLVSIAFVFFRSQNLDDGWSFLTSMFGTGTSVDGLISQKADIYTLIVMTFALIVCFAPALTLPYQFKSYLNLIKGTKYPLIFKMAVFILSLISLAGEPYTPFIYFQF